MRIRCFLAFVFIQLCFVANSQEHSFSFKHLSTSHGLSNATVYDVMQDSKGFIWIATPDGINKFNGYDFEVFKYAKANEYSLSHNLANQIFEDKNKDIWVATNKGLNKYNALHNSFTRFSQNKLEKSTIGSNYVTAIDEDANGLWITTVQGGVNYLEFGSNVFEKYSTMSKNESMVFDFQTCVFVDNQSRVWVGTYSGGVFLYNRQKQEFEQIEICTKNESFNSISKITQLNDSMLLIGTSKGLLKYNINNPLKYKAYVHKQSDNRTISKGPIKEIYIDNKGVIWVATQYGLDIFNLENNNFTHLQANKANNYNLTANEIWSICQDHEGTLWFGTYKGGVNILVEQHQQFNNWQPKLGAAKTESNSVLSFLENNDGKMWLGLDHGGLVQIDSNKAIIDNYLHSPNKHSLPDNTVLSIAQADNNNLWLGTFGAGLVKFNNKTKIFKKHTPLYVNANNWQVWDIFNDKNNELWLASFNHGLFSYKQQTNNFICHHDEGNNICLQSTGMVWTVFEDSKNRFWIGTTTGLLLFDKKAGMHQHYGTDKPDEFLDEPAPIVSIFEDELGRIWCGTEGKGLLLFNQDNGTFKSFNTNHGLIDNFILGILNDGDGALWLSTNKGISKIKVDADNNIIELQNFDEQSGIYNVQFNQGAHLKGSNGNLYFGNRNGFVWFNPNNIEINSSKPKVYVTNFLLFNKEVEVNYCGAKNTPISKHISETEHITLNHKQNVFSFKFAALSFIAPNKNSFAYILEGFEPQWNYVGNKREAHYTNLDAGEYVFRVKATNNDGVWSECSKNIIITVLPPWWEMWWVRALVILCFIISAGGFYYVRMNIMKIRQQKLEEKVKIRTAALREANVELKEHQEEINQQNEELKTQKEKIEINHKQITDSINYASRIQSAALPSPEVLQNNVSNHFIYFKPRNIVSGDFYWTRKVHNYLVIAAADCTGHGVPGAFVSMLGISFLNEISQSSEVWDSEHKASKILEMLRKKVKLSLKQKGGNDDSKDGMDISLCIIDLESNIMEFSGANNPICIVRETNTGVVDFENSKSESNNKFTITQLKPDMMPIGFYYREREFTNNIIQLKPNDKLYLFSDGYIDQFGGEFGKKIMMGSFRRILLSIQTVPFNKQKSMLDKTLKEWMKDKYEQIDDILIVGIEI